MKQINFKPENLYGILFIAIIILSSCSKGFKPTNLFGIYTGKERVSIRYDSGGQYFYRDEFVLVSVFIDSTGHGSGMVSEATLDGCNVTQNRGWIEQQLGIKTDFIISGMLKGNTFNKDTKANKSINLPFNIKNGELIGSLILNTKGEDFPIISLLKLKKRNN